MAASSIADTIVIRDSKQVETFADAVEKVAKNLIGHRKMSVGMVKDMAEFVWLMEKRRQLHG